MLSGRAEGCKIFLDFKGFPHNTASMWLAALWEGPLDGLKNFCHACGAERAPPRFFVLWHPLLHFVCEVTALYQALYRKWRPRTFDDVVGQGHITQTLKRQAATGRLSHAYLFTGTRGTGKTTCAKILARAVNCERPVDGNPCNECPSCVGIESGAILDVLELDAASNNGVDQVRALRDEAVYTPAAVKKRVYIVDEVHMLSTAAFNALLKILEEPPSHLMFILATTELHKVPATIKSRCQQFAFKRILPGEIAGRLSYVAGQEGMVLTQEGAALLARLADGGMRDALSLLDQCAGPAGAVIGEGEILDALGLAGSLETGRLLEQVGAGDAAAALETLGRLYGAGKDVGSLLNELSSLVRDLLVRRTAPQGGTALLSGGYDENTMRRLSNVFQTQRLVQMLGLLQKTVAGLSRSGNRRTDAELCLIRLCDPSLDESTAGLNARLARVEELLAKGGRPAASAPQVSAVKQPAAPVLPEPAGGEARPPWEEEGRVEAAPKGPEGSPSRAKGSAVGGFKPAAAPAVEIWPNLVAGLRGKIPMGEYTFLNNPAMVQGRLEGDTLTVWAESDFVKSMVGKPAVLEAIGAAASAVSGRAVRCTAAVGKPPAQAAGEALPAEEPEEHDRLDDLMAFGAQFDNIIIQE